MTSDSALDLLNAVKYIYLREIAEPRDNSLRLIVDEAVSNRSGIIQLPPELADKPDLANLLKDSWPIETVEGCKTFELYWKHYAAYLVTEELVGSNAAGGYEDEVFTGKILRVYSKSHFLDHIARDTGGHADSTVLHYKLVCLNHLIDVAAYAPPEIQVMGEQPKSRVH